MELSIERSLLANGLNLAQGIVERRNTVPILSNVLIGAKGNAVTLSATDLEVGIRTELDCQVSQPGMTTLNARKIYEIVKETESPEVVLRSLEGDWIEIKCGRARFKMMSLDSRSFPAMPGAEDKDRAASQGGKSATLQLGAKLLIDMIDKTLFAVSPDETRYNLSGVYFESPTSGTVRMVATDGHRLALIDRPAPGFSMSGSAILPRKGLNELRKLLETGGEAEVSLSLETQIAWLHQGKTEIAMRLVEGEFPDYRGVIPKSSRHSITVKRDDILAALKRAAIFSSERYHGIRVTVGAGNLTISSASPELGEASESIDTDFAAEEFSVGFNASYLLQALSVLPAESDIALSLTDEVSPGVLTTPTDSSFTYVVMPMRL